MVLNYVYLIFLNPQPKFFPSKSVLPSLIMIAAKIQKIENYFELADNIMNSLWVRNQDVDNEDVLINILNLMNLNSKKIISLQNLCF